MKKLIYIFTLCTAFNSIAQQNNKLDPKIIKQDTAKLKGCVYTVNKYPNGNKEQEGCTVNGLKEGIWLEYTEQENYVRFKWQFNRGLKNGMYYAYFKNGKVNAIGYYKNGGLTDTLTAFDEQGKLVSKSKWVVKQGKNSTMVWSKVYVKNAKQDGTIETINGKTYIWDLGEKVEIKTNK